jgi:hypothetical protein
MVLFPGFLLRCSLVAPTDVLLCCWEWTQKDKKHKNEIYFVHHIYSCDHPESVRESMFVHDSIHCVRLSTVPMLTKL